MASFLPVLQLFFCFIFSSHALYENISYNDIMLNMAELQRIAVQQKDLNNPSNIRPPFDDTVLHMISSPWKLLQDGSQIARKLNNGMSISADCDTGIVDTVKALMKGEGWAGRSKCTCINYHYYYLNSHWWLFKNQLFYLFLKGGIGKCKRVVGKKSLTEAYPPKQ